MKIAYISVLSVLLLAILYMWIRTRKSGVRLAKVVSQVCILGFVLVFLGAAAAMSITRTHALALHSARSVVADVFALFLILYAQQYTKIHESIRKRAVGSGLIRAAIVCVHLLVAVDAVSLLLNNFLHHCFDGRMVQFLGDQHAFLFYGTSGFYIYHLVLRISLIVIAGYMLWKKVLDTKGFYQTQYIVVFLLILFDLAVEGMNYYMEIPLDMSLLAYAVLAIFLSYYPLVYMPQALSRQMYGRAVENISMGLICYDVYGECFFANEVLRRMFPEAKSREEVSAAFRAWLGVEELSGFDNCMVHKKGITGSDTYYNVECIQMLDKRQESLGCFFQVQDRTVSVMRLEREKYVARHDLLTGVYTQGYFHEKAERLVRMHPEKRFYMICTNIKDFKVVNTLYGKETGDKILKAIADILKEKAPEESVYGRLGADHFALVISAEYFDEEGLVQAFQSVERVVEGTSFQVQISVGIYEIVEKEMPPAIWCDRAMMAQATIKGDLRFVFAYYTKSMMDDVLHEKRMIGEFDRAIAEKHFQLYLQPQVDGNGNSQGAEALVRWIHPEWGVVSPGDFIPVFEKTGLIHRLDAYVWEEACKLLSSWMQAGVEKHISVNISPRDLYYVDIYKIFTSLVEKYQLDVSRLHLELTETALMNDPHKQILLIQRLRDYGFQIEIDDFGSGYSSLNLLKDIEADVLKVDMEFLRDTQHMKRSRKILENIMLLSKALYMPVVVEGVETLEQLDFLRGIGADLFQGYYFSKPIPVAEFEDKYLKPVEG